MRQHSRALRGPQPAPVPDRAEPHDLPPTLTWPGTPGPLIGLTAATEPVYLAPDAGHTLVLTTAGGGTSVLLRTLAAQWAATGTSVDLIDDAFQHTWAHAAQRITLHHTADAIHARLNYLADIVRRPPPASPPARHAVVIDNGPDPELLETFREHPAPGATSLDALTTILAHGRPHGIQVVLARYELPPALTMTARDLFTTRLLGHASANAWRQAGAAGRRPRRPAGPGRMHILRPGTAPTPVQVIHLTEQQAAALAATPNPNDPGRSPR